MKSNESTTKEQHLANEFAMRTFNNCSHEKTVTTSHTFVLAHQSIMFFFLSHVLFYNHTIFIRLSKHRSFKQDILCTFNENRGKIFIKLRTI